VRGNPSCLQWKLKRLEENLRMINAELKELEVKKVRLERERRCILKRKRELKAKLDKFSDEGPWIENRTGLGECEKFLREKVKAHDFSRVVITLKYTRRNCQRPHTGVVYWPPPRSRKGIYTLICRVNRRTNFPYSCKAAIGTVQTGNGDYEYIYERVVFSDVEEAMIFVIGHEVFHYLRRTKQIPGRNTEPQANQFGLKWLEEFRKWRERRRQI